jgi:hypothetical protein
MHRSLQNCSQRQPLQLLPITLQAQHSSSTTRSDPIRHSSIETFHADLTFRSYVRLLQGEELLSLASLRAPHLENDSDKLINLHCDVMCRHAIVCSSSCRSNP